ncbi:hypothetical protein M5689_020046 [Euphorbia peplus]|nr:hypothetical protein M5689_020046 [Euphorbia peplus]
MVASVAGSLIYARTRRLTDVVPPKWRSAWKIWELRVLVCLSLLLQIILLSFGKRRKISSKTWLRVGLWCSYLMADWLAAVALGVLSNNLGDVLEEIGENGALDADSELTSFWAPFLLLHLGGPDTITAYAMEDNELWLRHLLGLGVQTAVASYILIMGWTGSLISILSIPMLLAGLAKYGERTYALWSASNGRFRDSMLTDADPGPNYPKFMQEFSLRQFEGYDVKAEEMMEAQAPQDRTRASADGSFHDENQLVEADNLFNTFKRLFVDLILSFQDREKSQSSFKNKTWQEAFQVIEIELGFVFDVLYTKAKISYSLIGLLLRVFSTFLTCVVLVLFSTSVANNRKYSNLKIDVTITYLLLAIAILLEIWAFLKLLSSDRTDLYFQKHRQARIVPRALTCWKWSTQHRWSNHMSQYSLLSVSIKSKPASFSCIQKRLHIQTILEKSRYTTSIQVPENLKESIFKYLMAKLEELEKDKMKSAGEQKKPRVQGSSVVLDKFGHPELKWSSDEVEFDQGILIWHMATCLCTSEDKAIRDPSTKKNRTMSTQLSEYMLYLLIKHPSMLPMGIGNIRYRDTCAEATRFFEERKLIFGNDGPPSSGLCRRCCACLCCCSKDQIIYDPDEACNMLLKVNTCVLPKKVKGDRSKSVLFDACKLASELGQISDKDRKWEMISQVWLEMLAYAASNCSGIYHAQQLRRGGELLTHVWLLMAHLGLTEQFQIAQGHARAKLVME